MKADFPTFGAPQTTMTGSCYRFVEGLSEFHAIR